MRRRTIQYLVLLSVLGLSIHLYFTSSYSGPIGQWLDIDSMPFGGAGYERHKHRPGENLVTEGDTRLSRPKGIPQPPGKPDPALTRPTMLPADVRKRDAVVDAFKHAWSAYERDAMGYDEYHPISHRGSNLGGGGGIGYTVVDAIDTMLLMGLNKEYETCKKWVQDNLSFDRNGYFSTFETTIRVLGGLLSAYHLTADDLYLQHATDLGDRMLAAFDKSPSGLPASHINLGGRSATFAAVSLAEAATLQLEFRYLAQLTGRSAFWHKAEKVYELINKARLPSGLAPIAMNMADGTFARSGIRMGSNGDSYYEYLLKQYIQTNQTEPVYLQMYTDAMQGVHDHLVQRTPRHNLTYIAELVPLGWDDWKSSWSTGAKQEHLACFLAGSLLLGATTVHTVDPTAQISVPPRMEQLTPTGQRDWATGLAYLEGCMDTHKTATGLAPEGVVFRTEADPGPMMGDGDERDWYIRGTYPNGPAPYDAHYILRPEISESVFLAWRLTGDSRYRGYAWDIFSAIERHCRLPEGGYATVMHVDRVPVTYEDKQETFFLSETLKYLFLTFADEGVLSLDEVVFNTEAHPLPIFNPAIKPLFTKYS